MRTYYLEKMDKHKFSIRKYKIEEDNFVVYADLNKEKNVSKIIKAMIKNDIEFVVLSKTLTENKNFINALNANNIKTYIINASKLAEENGIKGKISLIIETSILNLLNIPNYQNILIENVKERFRAKGESIVESNIKVIKETPNNLFNIKITNDESISINSKGLFPRFNFNVVYSLYISSFVG